MKKIYKFSALTLGSLIALSAAAPAAANAEFVMPEGWSIDSISYRILQNDTYADTVYINPDELINGSYTFQAGLYLEGNHDDFADMEFLAARWDGLDADGNATEYIKSDNIVQYSYQWNDEKTNMFFKEIEQASYDSEVPEHRNVVLCSWSKSTNAWINEVTGDNKMVQFDVTVDENTPEGVYYIGFDADSIHGWNFMRRGDTWLYPSNLYQIMSAKSTEVIENNDSSYWLKIIVGEQDEESEPCNIEDASNILSVYAENAAKSPTDIPLLKSTYMCDDVNGDGAVDIQDATYVLNYYAESAAGIR